MISIWAWTGKCPAARLANCGRATTKNRVIVVLSVDCTGGGLIESETEK